MILFLFLLLFFPACQSKPTPTSFQGFAMTIPYRITVSDPLTGYQKKAIEEELSCCFSKIDAIFNNWNPQSEISRLNHADAQERLKVSQELATLLFVVDEIHHKTEGRFDPTVSKLVALWKAALKKGEYPNPEELRVASENIGWHQVHLECYGENSEKRTLFWKEHRDTLIDLGGIAKGYAVDQLSQTLNEMGLKNYYVEWGGEIVVQGQNPERRPWTIGIAGSDISIEMGSGALATSGDYLQNWTLNGSRYCHIIDPRTQLPMEITDTSISSVTVSANSCAYADAVATALMLFPTFETANSWARNSLPDLKVWIGTHSQN